MRGPEEVMNAEAQSSSSREGGSEENKGRDPCSSPPCKRLKQAVLSFQTNTSTSSSSPPPSTPSPPKVSNEMQKKIIVIDENRAPNCGGLVTAAPSPPEKGHIKPQSSSVEDNNTTKDQGDDEKQPDISNTTVPNDKLNDSPKSKDQEKICSPKQTSNAKTPLKPTSAEIKKCKEEIQRIKEERQKLKEKKERQKLEAKVQKEKEKLEATQKKEQERIEKQQEKEKKEKEKLEKKQREEKEKQEKKEKKEEERRKKEEEVNAKLEGRKKKEEEKKQQDEELERKKKQASRSFKSFFTKTTNAPPKTLPKVVLKFEPFEIKPYMSLAPVLRKQLSKGSEQQLDRSMQEQEKNALYMKELKKRKPLPKYKKERRRTIASKSSNQEGLADKNEQKDQNDSIEISDDEDTDSESVVEIQQEEKKRMKAIFLKFHENNRPPYYGTHTKKSKKISPKNPLSKDEGLLNYEVDSDDEWEEEEPGESLFDDSDGDDDGDEPDDGGEEEDDGFMVPHGYLSDDEGINADEEENEGDSTSKQEQQQAKVKAWEAELKRKCKAKKPVCVGCVWPDYKNINEMLQQFEACILVDEPTIAIRTTSSTSVDSSLSMSEITTATPDSVGRSVMYVPEEAMPDLITLIHRSTAGVAKLIEYFKQHWSKKCQNTKAYPSLAGKGHISKRQLDAKIKAIATKERHNNKARWYVHGNILATYGLTKLATMDNEQRAPIGKPCSPQMLNTGVKVFTKSVSPSVNQGHNAVHQMMTFGNGKPCSPQMLNTGVKVFTKSVSPIVNQSHNAVPPMMTFVNGKPCSPQMFNTGVKVFTKSVSPSVNHGHNAVLQMMTSPHLQTGSSSSPNMQQSISPSTQSVSSTQVLQAQNDKQPSVTPVDKRRVVLQPASKTEVGAVIVKENLPNQQGSSVSHGSQAQSVTPVAKRRIVLQPASKTEVGAVIVKENLPNQQGSSVSHGSPAQSVTPVAKRRVVLQPISKTEVGAVIAKENLPNQQSSSNVQTSQVQNDKSSSGIPVAKRRAVLQPIGKPDIGGVSAKGNQPSPLPSGVEQKCNAVEGSNSCTATSMNTAIPVKNKEQGTTNISPPDGLMKNPLASTITTNSPSTSPVDAGCLSSAVKRTAPSPVGTDRLAKVPRKSEEAVEICHDVNKPAAVQTAESVVDTSNRPLEQGTLNFSQNSKEHQESKNSTSETAKLENPSKDIRECTLVINNVCKTDGVQPMEIEQITKA